MGSSPIVSTGSDLGDRLPGVSIRESLYVSTMYQEPELSRSGEWSMGWKATGAPSVRQQRGKWVVRVDGIDTATGKHRPRQLGTFASQRAAQRQPGRGRARLQTERGTVGWLVRR